MHIEDIIKKKGEEVMETIANVEANSALFELLASIRVWTPQVNVPSAPMSDTEFTVKELWYVAREEAKNAVDAQKKEIRQYIDQQVQVRIVPGVEEEMKRIAKEALKEAGDFSTFEEERVREVIEDWDEKQDWEVRIRDNIDTQQLASDVKDDLDLDDFVRERVEEVLKDKLGEAFDAAKEAL